MFFYSGAFFTIGCNFFPNWGQLGANVLVEFEMFFNWGHLF